MKKLLIASLLILFTVGGAYSQPVIDSTSVSVVNQDGVMTIDGSGFGIKSGGGPPLLWETFDDFGVNGDFLVDVKPEWKKYGEDGAEYSNTISHSGEFSAMNDMAGGGYVGFNTNYMNFDPAGYEEMYTSYWINSTNVVNGEQSGNWKMTRLGGNIGYVTSGAEACPECDPPTEEIPFEGGQGPYFGPVIGSISDAQTATTASPYVHYEVDRGVAVHINDNNADSSYISLCWGAWNHQQLYIKLSTPGVEDGEMFGDSVGGYQGGYDAGDGIEHGGEFGRSFKHNTAVENRLADQTGFKLNQVLLGIMAGSPSPHGGFELYIDDVYVDRTQARVELSNASTFDTATHREMQIPTVWADGQIEVTLNTGSFEDGETVYLIVVDSDGNESDGVELTVSATPAEPLAPVTSFSGEAPLTGVAPLTVQFYDNSSNSPTSWSWTFGDGGTSTLQNPSYTYTGVGTYTVGMTATNGVDSGDLYERLDYITATAPPEPSTGIKVLFSHQSVGRHIIADDTDLAVGLDATTPIRDLLDAEIDFWDHDYYATYSGLSDSDGNSVGNGYSHRGTESPNNDAGEVGLAHLIGNAFKDVPTGDAYSTAAEAEAWRDFCATFDIVIIKPGYRDVHILDQSELDEYKAFLNVASDWWEINAPNKYFVVMTSSSLRQFSDYSGSTAGFINDTYGVDESTRYAEFEEWLNKVWVCRSPYNRAFSTFRKCTYQSGTVDQINFTIDEYKFTDHHLNTVGSDAIQADLVDFINGMVEDMTNNTGTARPEFRSDY